MGDVMENLRDLEADLIRHMKIYIKEFERPVPDANYRAILRSGVQVRLSAVQNRPKPPKEGE